MKTLLARILCSAAQAMWDKDTTLGKYTSETEQHELNLAFHYACELRDWFPWLDCDFDVSKVACNYERPDIILHRRTTHALNFLVIEVKREKYRRAVSLDLKQIRERWFENYYRYIYGAAVILEDNKPMFEVQVLSREEKNAEPISLSHANMGKPLHIPNFSNGRYEQCLQEIERTTAILHAGNGKADALGRVMYALYDLTPEETKIVKGDK
jgi:hypothetical protein